MSEPVVAILAGGLGTRLGELAHGLPKPMIEVAGRPYLQHVVASFAERGLRRFVLLTGHHGDVIERHFGSGEPHGVEIEYSHEPAPIGTGGALRLARPLLGERFLVTYGDVLRRFDYDRFVTAHRDNCLAVYPRLSVGNAEVDGDRVTRYDKRASDLPFIDAGFSLMHASVLDLLPAEGACSFEEIVYSTLARRGELEAEVVGHDFFDIGTPEELMKTRAALERW